MVITAEIKDKVLSWIVENPKPTFLINDLAHGKQFEISSLTMRQILDQFERMKLINQKRHSIGSTISVNAEAHDLIRRGGFTIQEEIFRDTYEKLYLEIDSLKKDFPERAERFTTILSNLATMATFIGVSVKH